jgi:hypothetical protein
MRWSRSILQNYEKLANWSLSKNFQISAKKDKFLHEKLVADDIGTMGSSWAW